MNETAKPTVIEVDCISQGKGKSFPGHNFELLHGRIKSIDFQSGRVEIANKAKDVVWVRKSRLLELAAIAVKGTPARPAYIDFELDGRIVEDFREHKYV